MLSPDDYTQPVAPRADARSNNLANSAVDSKLETSGPGPKMVSFTMPAFGLVCATILIGFACAFVIGRMTVTPVQAANVESADSLPSPIADLSPLNDPMDGTPASMAAPGAGAAAADAAVTPAANAPIWGYQVMQYKGDAVNLADKYKDNLAGKGIDEVSIVKTKDTASVIVGGSASLKTLEKTWKQKLTEKGLRADPVKFTPPTE
ncbi:MAG TPA: hypothetical protein VL860_04005 [Planctomycetota bacterium]|jgi:hypothetical protein|nr:hypothetical protein [Planctomycetota bacterium]